MNIMRRSLKDIYNKNILLVPLLIGLVFIVVQELIKAAQRNYRPMLNKQQALDELIKNGDTQFDLSIVKVFEDKVWPYL